MSCPIHIWAPMMAAALPVARVARDRLRNARDVARAKRDASKPAPEIKRWAPIQPQSHRDADGEASAR